MPRTINSVSPISEGISRRFFAAVAELVDKKKIDSLSGFCRDNNLSEPRYRAMRLAYGLTPKAGYVSRYKNIELEALNALVSRHPVSALWLLTGRGNMFDK